MTTANQVNTHVIRLIQAMVGAISSNFRRVSIGVDDGGVRLQFVLERESAEDMHEISDIEFEFEALQEGPVDVHVETIVTAGPLSEVPATGRVVYGRREPRSEPA